MFLIRRTASGILVPVLMFAFEPDSSLKLMNLIKYFVQHALADNPGDTRVMICRYKPAVRALTDKLLPGKKGERVLTFERIV